jgi:hypothetical protein
MTAQMMAAMASKIRMLRRISRTYCFFGGGVTIVVSAVVDCGSVASSNSSGTYPEESSTGGPSRGVVSIEPDEPPYPYVSPA